MKQFYKETCKKKYSISITVEMKPKGTKKLLCLIIQNIQLCFQKVANNKIIIKIM